MILSAESVDRDRKCLVVNVVKRRLMQMVMPVSLLRNVFLMRVVAIY